MSQIVNWVCLLSITILVLDVMIYFCNDTIKTYNKSIRLDRKPVVKTRTYSYEEKIAK